MQDEKWLSFRCTEGEYVAMLARARDRGLKPSAYIVSCFEDVAELRDAVDWAIVSDVAKVYSARGVALNELAHALNSLALLASNDDFRRPSALSFADEATSSAFEVSGYDGRMWRSSVSFERACDVGVPGRAGVRACAARHVTMRVPTRTHQVVRHWSYKNGMSMTEAVLAQCVYRERLPIRMDHTVVEGMWAETARQMNNANQVGRALDDIEDYAQEYARENPLTESCRTLARAASDSTRDTAHMVEGILAPVMAAGRLARTL